MSLPWLPDAPVILDLCCKQGGAAMGFYRAGFNVLGFDIDPQPRYPFEFFQGDALQALRRMRADGPIVAVHISPPCRPFTRAQKIRGNNHPDVLTPARELLDEIGLPYIIENVPGAPLRDPVELCGAMFGLGTYRHRLFETNWPLTAPPEPPHRVKTTKMGRRPVPGEFMHVVGNFAGVDQAREAMGIDWMTRDGLRDAVPPAYTEHIGKQLLAHLASSRNEIAA